MADEGTDKQEDIRNQNDSGDGAETSQTIEQVEAAEQDADIQTAKAAAYELRQKAAAIRAQMATTDVSADLSELAAEFESLAASIEGDLAAGRIAMALSKAKGAGESISAAEGEIETFVSEFKSDVSYDNYIEAAQKFEEAQREYMRSMIAETQYYNAFEQELSQRYPNLNLTTEQKQDLAITTLVTQDNLVRQDRDIAQAVVIDQNASPESVEAANEAIAQSWKKVEEILTDPNVSQDKKDRIEALVKAWGNYPSHEAFELMQQMARGEAAEEKIQESMKEGSTLTALTYDSLLKNLFPPERRVEMEKIARELGYSSAKEMLLDNPLGPKDIDAYAKISGKPEEELTPEERLMKRRGEVAISNDLIRGAIQRTEFYLALGLEKDQFAALENASHADLIDMYEAGNDDAKELLNFAAMTADQKIELLVEKGVMDEKHKASALAMEYWIEASVAHLPEDERYDAKQLIRTKSAQAMESLTMKEGESPTAYQLRVKDTLLALEKDEAINRFGIEFTSPEHMIVVTGMVRNGAKQEEIAEYLEEQRQLNEGVDREAERRARDIAFTETILNQEAERIAAEELARVPFVPRVGVEVDPFEQQMEHEKGLRINAYNMLAAEEFLRDPKRYVSDDLDSPESKILEAAKTHLVDEEAKRLRNEEGNLSYDEIERIARENVDITIASKTGVASSSVQEKKQEEVISAVDARIRDYLKQPDIPQLREEALMYMKNDEYKKLAHQYEQDNNGKLLDFLSDDYERIDDESRRLAEEKLDVILADEQKKKAEEKAKEQVSKSGVKIPVSFLGDLATEPANTNAPSNEMATRKKIADLVMAGVDPALAKAAVQAEEATKGLTNSGVAESPSSTDATTTIADAAQKATEAGVGEQTAMTGEEAAEIKVAEATPAAPTDPEEEKVSKSV